ncbi:hypothetical protein LSCM1_06154 [Leishmania martiniquensis]|uniref:Transmembrane protein n=1 Tax=Leishmania martiniquensis TaxID=1580590 RepID=A0A836HL01_9TRYP|nr:hypothetical protein LSCM1_06154 [Leishmania martiniquensis]
MRRRGSHFTSAMAGRSSQAAIAGTTAHVLPSAAAQARVLTMATLFSTPLLTARRPKSFAARIHDMTIMRMGNSYKPSKYSSKDISSSPRAGVGHDPVFANYLFKKVVGPLRRKQGNSPEDFLSVDEASKWMEATNAAKVLGIKEDELPKLTKMMLEDKFRKEYKERSNAHQEEVVIATEVLLEYLDSSLYQKKNRQYYRKFLENIRAEVDAELKGEQSERNQSLTFWFGIAITGACAVIIFVAYSRLYVTRKDVTNIGVKVSEYFLMTFLQPKNIEPKPDYSTRYFNTPTAMELDRKNGRYGKQFLGADAIRQAELSAAYEEREEAEMVKLFNDEHERRLRDAQDDKARSSRVAVHLPEQSERAGEAALLCEHSVKTAFEKMTFPEFSGMLASNFGGGSRFQRLTADTSARAEHLDLARERLKSQGS